MRLIDAVALMDVISRQKQSAVSADYYKGIAFCAEKIAHAPTIEPTADRPYKAFAEIKVDTEEVVKRIKEEYDIVDRPHGEWETDKKPSKDGSYLTTIKTFGSRYIDIMHFGKPFMPNRECKGKCWYIIDDEWGDIIYDDEKILAWMPLPKPFGGGEDYE